jgi:xanthine dehydrogenase YagS FAD-binding subunit
VSDSELSDTGANGASFRYLRAGSCQDAAILGAQPDTAFLAGGTDFLQLWKAGLQRPRQVVDISRLPLDQIKYHDGKLTMGALARLGTVARHEAVHQFHPLIAQAIRASASGQLQNMASIGGNLLQRTRCLYFRTEGLPCNKRVPGSGCAALTGENRQAALFGGSAACVATHASDLAVALAALDAEVEVLGQAGARRIPLTELYRLPGDDPARDTSLKAGELITEISVGNAVRFAASSTYLKIRDRASFDFSVISMAAALQIEDGVIIDARLAAGGVAPMPWRLPKSEAALLGRKPDTQTFSIAADLAIAGAQALSQNAFKVGLLRSAVIRSLQTIAVQS